MESEGPAEKYRAVIDGGDPVMNRSAHWWGKVEPVIRGRKAASFTHPLTKVIAGGTVQKNSTCPLES